MTSEEREQIERTWRELIFMGEGLRRFFPPEFPRIVCLCGSTRFGDAYKDALRSETLAGRIVLSVGLLGHSEGIDMDGPVKAALDELHLRKIDVCDELLVLNVRTPVCSGCGKPVVYDSKWGGNRCDVCSTRETTNKVVAYVGPSTRREIEYATAMGKPCRYLETPS